MAERTPPELGEPLEEFGPALQNVVAGYLLGGVALPGGLLLAGWLAWVFRDLATLWAALGAVGVVFGLSAALWGFYTLRYANHLRNQTITVCANGLYLRSLFDNEAVPW